MFPKSVSSVSAWKALVLGTCLIIVGNFLIALRAHAYRITHHINTSIAIHGEIWSEAIPFSKRNYTRINSGKCHMSMVLHYEEVSYQDWFCSAANALDNYSRGYKVGKTYAESPRIFTSLLLLSYFQKYKSNIWAR